jgi:hypothetical protein
MTKHVYLVSQFGAVSFVTSNLLAAYNYAVSKLPPGEEEGVKSYSQFARDVKNGINPLRLVVGTGLMYITLFPVMTKYKV